LIAKGVDPIEANEVYFDYIIADVEPSENAASNQYTHYRRNMVIDLKHIRDHMELYFTSDMHTIEIIATGMRCGRGTGFRNRVSKTYDQIMEKYGLTSLDNLYHQLVAKGVSEEEAIHVYLTYLIAQVEEQT
jgi:hypothetical protein